MFRKAKNQTGFWEKIGGLSNKYFYSRAKYLGILNKITTVYSRDKYIVIVHAGSSPLRKEGDISL
jgi:hypothetical protein